MAVLLCPEKGVRECTRAWAELSESSYNMKNIIEKSREAAAAGWIFLWLLGVPIPVLLVLYLLRGCT